jgi:hypothetical protein
MLVIRNQQLDAFRPLLRQRFEDALTDIVAASYPGVPRAQVGQLVALGVQEAAARSYVTKRQVSVYVSLMLMLGVDFASDPQLPWVAAYLDERAIADPTMRIEQLFAASLAYLGATAGEQGERMAGVLVRMRAFDLASVPGRTGEAWISDIARILEAFHPEKFRHQGEPAMRKLIWVGTRRAHKQGIRERGEVFAFVTLMFFFGSGFDRDPLYPWAAASLSQGGAARLYAGALAHLELTTKVGN